MHLLTYDVSTGNTVVPHALQGNVDSVRCLNHAGGRNHNVAYAENLAGIYIVDKLSDVIVCRLRKHLLRCCHLHHPALAQNSDVASKLEGLVDVMGDEHNSLAHFFLNTQKLELQIIAHQGIKGGESFVHQQNIRIVCKCAGDSHPLLHTSAKAVDGFVFPAFEPYHRNHFHTLGFPFCLPHAPYFKTVTDI